MAVAVLEPPTTLEGDGSSGDDALQLSATVRADRDLGVGELLNVFGVLVALLAFVFVKRHGEFL